MNSTTPFSKRGIYPLFMLILLLLPLAGRPQSPDLGYGTNGQPIPCMWEDDRVFPDDDLPEGGGNPIHCMSMIVCDTSSWRDADPADPNANVIPVSILVRMIRDDQGNASATLVEVDSMMRNVRDHFRGVTAFQFSQLFGFGWTPDTYDTKIELCWEIQTIDDSNLYTMNSLMLPGQFPPSPNRLRVFINDYSQGFAWGGGGIAYVPYGSVNSNYNKTLTHEIGHALGLMHTFRDQAAEDSAMAVNCAPCYESLAMTTAGRDTTGDMCGDTDPDFDPHGKPCMYVWSSGFIHDCGGIPITWQTRFNFMSYSTPDDNAVPPCRAIRFSRHQANRMRCHLNNYHPNYEAYAQLGCPDWIAVDFIANPRQTCVGTPVQFTDLSVGSAAATGWLWDFGDGNTSTAQNPIHVYTTPGTYTVTLTVSLGGFSATATKTAYIDVAGTVGIPVPYFQDFNTWVPTPAGAAPAGWLANDLQGDNNVWHTVDTVRYRNPYTPTWPTVHNEAINAPGQWTLLPIDPTGVHSAGMMMNNLNRDGVGQAIPGDIDELITPIFDLTNITNPRLRFFWSHIPMGDTIAANACGWTWPGLPTPTPDTLNPYFDWAPCSCENDRVAFYYSTDCGDNWNLMQMTSGQFFDFDSQELSTIPGQCTPWGYTPQDSSNWRLAEFDLCFLLGNPKVQFKWEYTHVGFRNNYVWLDNFSIDSNGGALTLSSSTGDDCGKCTGGMSVTASGGTAPYSWLFTDNLGQVTALPATGATVNADSLCGSQAGAVYTFSVTDALGNCAIISDTVFVDPTLTVTLSTTDETCGDANGSVTATIGAPLTGVPPYVLEVFDQFGTSQGTSGPGASPLIFGGLSAGSYEACITDAGGNCAVIPFTINNLLTQTISATVTYDCANQCADITVTAPIGAGYTYTLTAQGQPTGISNTTGVFTCHSYDVYLIEADNGAGGCGLDTIYANNPPLDTLTLDTLIHEKCGNADGEIQVTLAGPGPITYYLTNGNSFVVDSNNTGIFTGLDQDLYFIEAFGQGGGCGQGYFAVLDTNTLAPFIQINDAVNCTPPDGSISFTTFGMVQPITYTLTDLTNGQSVPGVPFFGNIVFNGLAPGGYELYIVDANGDCYRDVHVVLQKYITPTFDSLVVVPDTCGSQVGSITYYNLAGGTLPWWYYLRDTVTGSVIVNWDSTSATNLVLDSLTQGVYELQLADDLGDVCHWQFISVGDTCCNPSGTPYVYWNGKASELIADFGGSPVSGINISLNGTFTVDVPLQLSGCTVDMAPESRIEVQSGQSLRIAQGSTVQAGCGIMWDQIHVPAGATLRVLGSTVRDGEQAVTAEGGGFYQIQNSFFENNYYGLVVKNHSGTQTGTVTGTLFHTPTTLLPPYAGEIGEAGIWLDRAGTAQIGQTGIQNRNTFFTLGTGIFIESTNATVENAVFETMQVKPQTQPVPLYYGVGVFARHAGLWPGPGAGPNLTVGGGMNTGCKFLTSLDGVRVEGRYSATVTHNEMESLQRSGVWVQNAIGRTVTVENNRVTDVVLGVTSLLNTNALVSISDNDFTNGPTWNGWAVRVGDLNYGQPNASGGVIVESNEIDTYGAGIDAFAAGDIEVKNNNIYLNDNTPNSGDLGIRLQGCFEPVVVDNQVKSNVGIITEMNGIWIEETPGGNVSCNTLRSLYRPMTFFGPNVAATSVWKNEYFGGHWGLVLWNDGDVGPQGAPGQPTGNNWIGSFSSGSNASTLNTVGANIDWFVRNVSTQNPALSGANTGASPINFLSTNGPTNFNCLTGPVGGGGGGGGGGGNPNKQLKDVAQNQVNYMAWPTEGKYLDEQWAYALLCRDTALCLSDTALFTFHQAQNATNQKNLLLALQAAQDGNVTALNTWNQFVPGSPIEAAHKDVNGWIAKLLAQGPNGLTPTDRQGAELLAAGCPATSGKAVYQARALVRLWNPLAEWANPCVPSQKSGELVPGASGDRPEPALSIFPNPTRERVSLDGPGGKVEILDMHGRKVQELNLGEGGTEIDTGNWTAGVYFVRWNYEGLEKVYKLIIQ